jgi:hypothetical protein
MSSEPSADEWIPSEPDIDENGIDRAQIRAMLALSPADRLERIEEFVQSLLEIRQLNERRTFR